MREIGERLKARREYLGLNQEDVANVLSMTRANYARYESGRISMSAPDLALAAAFLKAPAAWFLGDETNEDIERDEFLRFYEGQPPNVQLRISRSMRALFDLQDTEDDEGTIGKKAE